MSKWSLLSARIDASTSTSMVIASSTAKRSRMFLTGLLLLTGVGGMFLGLALGEINWVLGTGALCLLPGLILLFAISLSHQVTLDAETQTVKLTKVYLLDLGQWSGQREKLINFSSMKQAGYKTDLLGSSHRVEMSTRDGQKIVLQFGPQADEAKGAARKIAELLEPSLEPGIELEAVPVPSIAYVTKWRLGLASLYGLTAALTVGYGWYLLTRSSGVRLSLTALLLGLVVGLVVSFMGGGSDDERYAILGAVLSGVGIAFGEFLIFGLPDSKFIYEFDVGLFIIYGLALYEGWVIPRRSSPLAQIGSRLIHESNWIPFMAVGGVALLSLLIVFGLTGRLPSREASEAKTHYDQATSLVENGNLEEAITEYQEAVRLKPDYALAHNDLGIAYYQMEQLDLAETEFQEAILADPNWALAHANLAMVYNDLGRFNEGLDEVNEALRLDSSLPTAHLALGYLNSSLGRPDEAQAEFEKTLELDSSILDAHIQLGFVHMDQENWELAIDRFSKALEIKAPSLETSIVYSFRGYANLAMSNYEEALKDTNEAVRYEPSNAFAYYVRGIVYANLEDRENAIADLEKALELNLEPELRQSAESILQALR